MQGGVCTWFGCDSPLDARCWCKCLLAVCQPFLPLDTTYCALFSSTPLLSSRPSHLPLRGHFGGSTKSRYFQDYWLEVRHFIFSPPKTMRRVYFTTDTSSPSPLAQVILRGCGHFGSLTKSRYFEEILGVVIWWRNDSPTCWAHQ